MKPLVDMTRDELVAHAASIKSIDAEALAYSKCVDAIQQMPKATPQLPLFYTPVRDTSAIRRVLLALSERYGCDLIRKPKPPPEPVHECNCDYCEEP